MSYEHRAYDNEHGDPVVVLVATGTHDVSRLVNLLHRGNTEQLGIAAKIVHQVRRHNAGRAALRLLRDHGGPDFTGDADDDTRLELLREVAGTPAAEPADVLPPREPGDLRPAVERALKMLEGSVLAREVLRLRDVADSLRTDLRRERAAAELAHATVDRLTSTPAAEPAPDRERLLDLIRTGARRADPLSVPCRDCGQPPRETCTAAPHTRDSVDGVTVTTRRPKRAPHDIRTWDARWESIADEVSRGLCGAGAPTEPVDDDQEQCALCAAIEAQPRPMRDLAEAIRIDAALPDVLPTMGAAAHCAYLQARKALRAAIQVAAELAPALGAPVDDTTKVTP